MQYSDFGQKFSGESGIQSLMDELGAAMSGGGQVAVMGGGNPAFIAGEMARAYRG